MTLLDVFPLTLCMSGAVPGVYTWGTPTRLLCQSITPTSDSCRAHDSVEVMRTISGVQSRILIADDGERKFDWRRATSARGSLCRYAHVTARVWTHKFEFGHLLQAIAKKIERDAYVRTMLQKWVCGEYNYKCCK